MMPQLTNEQIRDIESGGIIPTRLKEKDHTLHFCPDWDFMLIAHGDPEWEACCCDIRGIDDEDF